MLTFFCRLYERQLLYCCPPGIECFHSRGQHICKFIVTKESVCIRKEFNSQGTGLGHQYGRRFIVLGHQYGRRDVMWKHSIAPLIVGNIDLTHLKIELTVIVVVVCAKNSFLLLDKSQLQCLDRTKKWLVLVFSSGKSIVCFFFSIYLIDIFGIQCIQQEVRDPATTLT